MLTTALAARCNQIFKIGWYTLLDCHAQETSGRSQHQRRYPNRRARIKVVPDTLEHSSNREAVRRFLPPSNQSASEALGRAGANQGKASGSRFRFIETFPCRLELAGHSRS